MGLGWGWVFVSTLFLNRCNGVGVVMDGSIEGDNGGCGCSDMKVLKSLLTRLEFLEAKVTEEVTAKEELWLRDQMHAAELREKDDLIRAKEEYMKKKLERMEEQLNTRLDQYLREKEGRLEASLESRYSKIERDLAARYDEIHKDQTERDRRNLEQLRAEGKLRQGEMRTMEERQAGRVRGIIEGIDMRAEVAELTADLRWATRFQLMFDNSFRNLQEPPVCYVCAFQNLWERVNTG